jgi:hypothetical protein
MWKLYRILLYKERVGASLYHRVYSRGHVASSHIWVARNTGGRKVCLIKVLAYLYVLFEHSRNRIDWFFRRIDWISKWLLVTSRNRGKKRDDLFRMRTTTLFQPCETERSENRLEFPMHQPMHIDWAHKYFSPLRFFTLNFKDLNLFDPCLHWRFHSLPTVQGLPRSNGRFFSTLSHFNLSAQNAVVSWHPRDLI